MEAQNKKTLEDRLNEVLSEKEDEIENLKNKLDEAKDQLDYHKWKWERHRYLDNDEFYKGIPCPRLEMIIEEVDEFNFEYVYGFVYRPFWFEWDFPGKLQFIPISLTKTSNGRGGLQSLLYDNKLQLPIRDGLHIKADAYIFNLPAYISIREYNRIEKIDINEGSDISKNEIVKRMKF